MIQDVYEASATTPLCWTRITFPGGGVCDPPDAGGLADLAFDLAMRGTSHFGHVELQSTFGELGAQVAVSVTPDDVTFHSVCLGKFLPRVWGVMTDLIAQPAMTEDELGTIVHHRRHSGTEDDDEQTSRRCFDTHCCPGSPYSRSTYGIPDVGIARLRAEVQCTITRGGALIGFSGHIHAQPCDRLASELRQRLLPLPARISPAAGEPTQPVGRRLVIVDKPGRTQAHVRIGHLAPRWGTEDFLHLTPVVGVLHNRLHGYLRERRGWSYAVDARMRHARGPHWLEISMVTEGVTAARAIAAALETYERIHSDGIHEEALDYSKNTTVRGYHFNRATPRIRMERRIKALSWGWPHDHMTQFDERLDGVTLAETRAAIDTFLNPANLCVVIVCDAGDIRRELEAIGWDDVAVEA